MLKYSYYPFKNDLEKIDGSDLSLLKNISEGWYIDYKVQGLKVADFGKHLSAFANQYGGWLIIGVSERDDSSRTADKFPGIDKSEVAKVSLALREATSAHVNPEVLYEEKVLDGPIDEISLEKGKSIIVVGVPRSVNTPHIHSSGRIYRRVADQSKPKEETDRYILDELWKRGNDHQEKLKRALTNIPKLPECQSKLPFAHIYFKPSDGQLPPKKKLEFDEFVRIVTNSDKKIFGVHAPMQAINTTVNGFVARQIEGNDPSLASLSLNWWHDGTVRFDIPLNVYDFSRFLDTHETNKYAKQYCQLAHSNGYQEMKIVDYSIFFQTATSLVNCYLHMLDSTDDKRDVFSCFTLRNVFQTSPFVDSKTFIERIKKFSLPLTSEQDIVFPREPTEDNMFLHKAETRFSNYTNNETYQPIPYCFASPVIYMVFSSVGLVSDVDTFLKDTDLWGFDKVKMNFSKP